MTEEDVRNALVQATRTGRRILLDVGGEWCIWCKRLDAFFLSRSPVVGRISCIEGHLCVVKVNFRNGHTRGKALCYRRAIPICCDDTGKLVESERGIPGRGSGRFCGNGRMTPGGVSDDVRRGTPWRGNSHSPGMCCTQYKMEIYYQTREDGKKPVPHPLILLLLGVLLVALHWRRVPAPNFTLQSLDGKTVELKKLAGKAVVVNFWATWCGRAGVRSPG